MSSINPQDREINVKIVYYGPGLGGKTSSLQALHRIVAPNARGQLISLATGNDRTLYFDLLPVRARFRGMTVRLQLYTVPGQVHYKSTRKLVLNGADAVVFVADSQRGRFSANQESFRDLEENIKEQGRDLAKIPLIFQYNKRDVPDAVPVEELDEALNRYESPTFASVATDGTGVYEALRSITTAALRDLERRGKTMAEGLGKESGDEADDGSKRRKRAETSPLLQSLTELAEAMAETAAPAANDPVDDKPMPSTGKRSWVDLVRGASTRKRIAIIEEDIDRSKWTAAVKNATSTVHWMVPQIAGSAGGQGESLVLASFELGLPPAWYRRFAELEQRILGDGAVTSEDAMFALFFCCAVALGGEERMA